MALNFPADPSDGDVYEGYVWNDTVGAWQTVSTAISAINDIDDVSIDGTPADNEVLAYDSSSGEWINQTATEAGIATETYVTDNSAPKLLLETSEQTASYTLALTDINKVVLMNVDTGTLTIPTNASVAFSIGTVINVYNINPTDLVIQGDTGVTVRNSGSLAEYGEVSLRKRATDEWVLAGNVS